MLAHQRLELPDQPCVLAERQPRVDSILKRGKPRLPKPGDLALRETLVGEISQRLPTPQRKRRAATRALALWRGEPLADFAYEGFAQGEIARLGQARLAALEDRIDARLALGEHARLVGELEALVREHPSRERLVGQLMVALYRSGDRPTRLRAIASPGVGWSTNSGSSPVASFRSSSSDLGSGSHARRAGPGYRSKAGAAARRHGAAGS